MANWKVPLRESLSTPSSLRQIFRSLEEWLAQPQFDDGIAIGNASLPTYNSTLGSTSEKAPVTVLLKRFTGTLSGAGAATITHGITGLNQKTIFCQAWYQGASNESIQITAPTIGSTTISLSGGGASKPYRVTVLYSADTSGW